MEILYEAQYQVAWVDVDMNGHMANSKFLDYATQTRFRSIASRGFSPADFQSHGVGPVIFEDHLRYHRELRFLDEFTVTHSYESLDAEGRKFRVVNLFRRDGEEVAEVTALGAWFDLRTRKIVAPPADLAAALT